MYILLKLNEVVTTVTKYDVYSTTYSPLVFTTMDEAIKAAPKYGRNVTVAKLVAVANVEVEQYERVVIDPLLGET